MLKVFLIATEFHRSRGGIQYVNRLLVRGFEDVAARTPLALSVFSYSDRPEDFSSKAAVNGTRWQAFSRSGLRMGLALARALLRQQPDVVLLTHVSLLPFLRLVQRLAPGARTALLAHGIEVWRPLAPATQRALRRLHNLVAPSVYTAAQLREQNGVAPDRLSVLPHGLDPDWTTGDHPFPQGQAPTLLSVGRLNVADRLKGVDVVLRAMPHILDRIPEARYVVVGDGDDRPRLEQLAADSGVAAHVEFRGDLGGADLLRAYADADVFVLPSQKEGFGIVFAEAMWLRLPVVAARAGAAGEVIEDGRTGILVPPDSPEQIASAVTGLLLLDDERRTMGAAGRQRVEEHYLFPQFVARWHRWLASMAPEAVYLARHSGLRATSEINAQRVSH